MFLTVYFCSIEILTKKDLEIVFLKEKMRNYFVRIILGILLLVFTYREALGIVNKSGKEVYEAWKNVNIYEDKESI